MAVLTVPARVSTASLNKTLKKVVEPGKIKNTLLTLYGSRGAIVYNCGGKKTDWPVQYNQFEPEELQDGDPISSARRTRERMAEVDWRAWVDGESFGKFERLVLQDSQIRLFDVLGRAVKSAREDFRRFLGRMVYANGDSTTVKVIDGLETMYSDQSASTGSSALGFTGTPAGSYAGLSMVLNAYGTGSWGNGTFPAGIGLLPYYFFSPITADATADWGQSASTWAANWRLCLNHCVSFTEALHGVVPEFFVTTPLYLTQAQNSLIDKERINVGSSPELTKLGFRNIDWNGLRLMSDWQCTQNVCYGMNMNHTQIRCMEGQLVTKEGDEDITINTKIVQFQSWLNMMFETPGFFPCVRELT